MHAPRCYPRAASLALGIALSALSACPGDPDAPLILRAAATQPYGAGAGCGGACGAGATGACVAGAGGGGAWTAGSVA